MLRKKTENKFGCRVTRESLLRYASVKKEIVDLRKFIGDSESMYGNNPYWYPVDVREKYVSARRRLPELEKDIPAINDFTDNVINKFRHYWGFLSECNFDSELLKYLVV